MEDRTTFTEREAADIVRRAGELQLRTNETGPRGIKADDLRRMAEELGIEPRFLEQALQEGPAESRGAYQFSSRRERLVDGEPDFDMLAELSATSSLRSTARQIGNTFVASVMKGGGRHIITVRKTGDQTRVAIESKAILPVVFGGLGTFYAFLFSMAALDSAQGPILFWMPLLIVAFWAVAAALIARPLMAKAHKAGDELLEQYSAAVKPVASEALATKNLQKAPPVQNHSEETSQNVQG